MRMVGTGGGDIIADGVHDMRLAQPHAAVDEEGIIALARLFRDRLGGGIDELVALAHDEIVEGEAAFEARALERSVLRLRRALFRVFGKGLRLTFFERAFFVLKYDDEVVDEIAVFANALDYLVAVDVVELGLVRMQLHAQDQLVVVNFQRLYSRDPDLIGHRGDHRHQVDDDRFPEKIHIFVFHTHIL